jgi:hypothetical protein
MFNSEKFKGTTVTNGMTERMLLQLWGETKPSPGLNVHSRLLRKMVVSLSEDVAHARPGLSLNSMPNSFLNRLSRYLLHMNLQCSRMGDLSLVLIGPMAITSFSSTLCPRRR